MTTKDTPPKVVTLAQSDALNAIPPMRLDPQALIAKAIESGASIETLERLVNLAKDIRAMVAREAYFDAVALFQKRCPPIKKNKVMAVPGRPTYRYSDLGEILSTIGPLMGELGLSHSWRSVAATKPNHVAKVCQLAHRLGHTEDSGPCELPYSLDSNRMNGAQAVGSAETYAKRYSLCSVLGISPEDDDDARASGALRDDEGRSHGEAASGAGERGETGRESPWSRGLSRETLRPNSPSGERRGAGPDSDKVEAEITVPSDLQQNERATLVTKIEAAKRTEAQILLAMHRLDLGDGDWRALDLAGLAMLAKHLAPKA